MTRPPFAALALLAGLLTCVTAFPPVAAGTNMIAAVSAAGLEAPDGHLDASLLALEQLSQGVEFHFLLSGLSAEAVLEQESGPIIANQTPYDTAALPGMRSYRNLTDGAGLLRFGHQAYVLALPGEVPPRIVSSGPCAAVVPTHRNEVEIPVYVETAQSRHRETVPVGHTLAWNSAECSSPAFSVEGGFLLSLWEADLSFRHADGNASYSTGQVSSTGAFDLAGNHTDRQLFLTVRSGRLDLMGANPSIYFPTADLDASHLRINGATGTVPAIPGTGRSEGQNLDLKGKLSARLVREASGVGVTVTGDLDSASVDGQSVVVAAPNRTASTAWIALLFLAPVAVGGGTVALRRRPATVLAHLEGLAMAGQHDAVAKQTRRLQRAKGLELEATALRVQALANLGRFDEALAQALLLPPMESAMAVAFTHAIAGDAPACAAALQSCATLDADWVRVALLNPIFAEAGRHDSLAWLEKARGGKP
ncbi:MAG: hypothetical protein WC876_02230 [Candidatus Thermoplasmatota archaeon]|jgi:hypothetical protein